MKHQHVSWLKVLLEKDEDKEKQMYSQTYIKKLL